MYTVQSMVLHNQDLDSSYLTQHSAHPQSFSFYYQFLCVLGMENYSQPLPQQQILI